MTASLIDAAILIGTTLATTLFLLLLSGQLYDTTAGNLIARSAAPAPEPIVTGQPTPEQSLLGSRTASPQPSRSAASPTLSPAAAENETATSVTDDTTIQAALDKRFQDNTDLSLSGITATISNGTVTLVGTVPSDEVKEKIEKLVRTVKGVKHVDNQIVVLIGAAESGGDDFDFRRTQRSLNHQTRLLATEQQSPAIIIC